MAMRLTAEELERAAMEKQTAAIVVQVRTEGLKEAEGGLERLVEKLEIVEQSASKALERLRELNQFLEKGITGGLERLQEFQDILEAMGAERVEIVSNVQQFGNRQVNVKPEAAEKVVNGSRQTDAAGRFVDETSDAASEYGERIARIKTNGEAGEV